MNETGHQGLILRVADLASEFGDSEAGFNRKEFVDRVEQILREYSDTPVEAMNSAFDDQFPYYVGSLGDSIGSYDLVLGMVIVEDVVLYIFPGLSAEKSGFEVGDKLISVKYDGRTYLPKDNGQPVLWSQGLEPIQIEILRRGRSQTEELGLTVNSEAIMGTRLPVNGFVPTARLTDEGVGYISMPPLLLGDSTEHILASIEDLHDQLAGLSNSGVNKWIIDLRVIAGDHRHQAALLALGQLLPDGVLAYEVPLFDNSGSQMVWQNDKGRISLEGASTKLASLTPDDFAPVSVRSDLLFRDSPCGIAVLLSRKTERSLIGQLLSFIYSGRSNVRLFGWGLSPTDDDFLRSSRFPLDDEGTFLTLLNRKLTDHLGDTRLNSTVNRPPDWESFGGPDDRLLIEASSWLNLRDCNK